MNHALRSIALAAAVAALAPLAARAEGPRIAPALPTTDILTAQEREMLGLAQDLAKKCAEVLEKWLASNEVTEDQLFNQLYYPIASTEPPKFHTDWDKLSDRDLQELEEQAMARSDAIAYVVLTDVNGYVPTHNKRYSQPLTGDRGVDLVANRTKRIFNNNVEIRASRNTESFITQKYYRDNGEVLEDIGVPVMVRGRHFGAIRLGFRPVVK